MKRLHMQLIEFISFRMVVLTQIAIFRYSYVPRTRREDLRTSVEDQMKAVDDLDIFIL